MEGWQSPTPPPPPTPVSPRVEIKPIVERPPAGAPSVGAWKLNCALKQYFQLTLIQSSKRVYSNLIKIVLLFRGGGKWGARKME